MCFRSTLFLFRSCVYVSFIPACRKWIANNVRCYEYILTWARYSYCERRRGIWRKECYWFYTGNREYLAETRFCSKEIIFVKLQVFDKYSEKSGVPWNVLLIKYLKLFSENFTRFTFQVPMILQEWIYIRFNDRCILLIRQFFILVIREK